MRLFLGILTALCIIGVPYGSSAHAQDVYIGDRGEDTVLSGVVTDIGGDSMRLSVNGEEVRVDAEDLNLDEGQGDLIKTGDRIQLRGKFESDEFEARSLVLLESGADANVVVDDED